MPQKRKLRERYAHLGPWFWTSAIVFFVAQIAVAYNWRTKTSNATIHPYHPYSFLGNTISDLGETAKYTYGHPAMWSPDWLGMDLALGLLGLVMIIGAPLTYFELLPELPGSARRKAAFGFSAQAVGGLGALVVALAPENTISLLHELGAGLAIGIGSLGVLVLSFALELSPAMTRFMRSYMPVAIIAIALYALHEYLGFGPGGMERIAAYPEVIWLIAFGSYRIRKRLGSRLAGPGPTPTTGHPDPSDGGPQPDTMAVPIS
jgi:hypothetical membrane protein